MKLRLTIFIIFISTFWLWGQKKEVHKVLLKPVEEKITTSYFCDSIIDLRPNKEYVGFVQKGITNKQYLAELEDRLTLTLKNHINNELINYFSNSAPLVFIIHDFFISERTTAAKETGTCYIEVEFAQIKDEQLYSLGTYFTEVSEGAIDITKSHNRRINTCLLQIFEEYNKDGSVNKEGELLSLEHKEHLQLDINSYSKTAYYASFSQLLKNNSLEYFKAKLTNLDLGQGIVQHRLKAASKKNRRKVKFITHNNELYMNALSYCYANYFVKAKHYGRYIYFEDRIPDLGASLALGLIGTAISNTRKSIILDSKSGLVVILNQKMLSTLTKDYPDIYNEFINSKKKYADFESAIAKLNEYLATE